jgi:hypothetical protein
MEYRLGDKTAAAGKKFPGKTLKKISGPLTGLQHSASILLSPQESEEARG